MFYLGYVCLVLVLGLRGHCYGSPFTSSTHPASQRAPSTQGSSYCATLTRQAHRHFNRSPWGYQCRSCFRFEPASTTTTGHGPRFPAQSSLFVLRFNLNQHWNLGQAFTPVAFLFANAGSGVALGHSSFASDAP